MPQAIVTSASTGAFSGLISSWRLPLVASTLLVPGVWFKTIVDRGGGDVLASRPIDLLVWILLCGLKLVTLVFVPIAMARAAARGYHDIRAAARCASWWLGSGLAVLAALSLFRAPMAALLMDDTTKFYPTTLSAPSQHRFSAAEVARFVPRWRSGTIFAEEAALVFIAVLGVTALGYAVGRRRRLTTISCGAWLLATLYLGNWLFDLLPDSFDFFMAGTLISPLVLDVLFFFIAKDSVTPVTSIVYAAMIWSSYAVVRAPPQSVVVGTANS